MRYRPLLLLVVPLARLAAAQVPDTTRLVPGATVSGVVRDSVAGAPLAGAIVQLVAAGGLARVAHTAVSDSLGRFSLADIPDGRYMLGFFHPMLDSLGLEPTLREVSVDGHRPVRADLAIPSPARIRAAICGPALPSATSPGAVVIGVVRDAATRAPAAGVSVTGEWLEMILTRGGLDRRIPHVIVTSRENGWFAICNVPSAGTVSLIANRGADSTDLIDVQIPAEGFLRRELYVGSARDGRLSGTVVSAKEGRPLPGAQVGIANGPRTRANEHGEWTLVDVPSGTRMLEVRAVGYYPERRPVDVTAGAAPVRVALSTFDVVLESMKITAAALSDFGRSGFQERQRSGAGRYLTPQDIARRQFLVTSDVFRNQPGVRLQPDPGGFEKQVLVRGNTAEWCSPALYFNGHYVTDKFTAEDIDVWVHLDKIVGIEIYSGPGAPAEFQRARTGCGSIVIWTK